MPATIISPTQLLPPQLLAQLERLELVSRKVFRGRMKGERKSKRKGESVEFADFRQYVAGGGLWFFGLDFFARGGGAFLKWFFEGGGLDFFCRVGMSGG